MRTETHCLGKKVPTMNSTPPRDDLPIAAWAMLIAKAAALGFITPETSPLAPLAGVDARGVRR